MELSVLVAAVVTVIAALITLFGAFYTQRKTAETAVAISQANNDIKLIARESSERHEKQMSLLSSRLEQAVHKANHAHSKKLEVLSYSYSRLGEIKYLIESYLTPYTAHRKSGSADNLKEASLIFNDLRKYHLMNAIFFDAEEELGKAMSEIMGQLNVINGLADSAEGANDDWKGQVESFQTKIEPAILGVKEAFKRSLELG